MLRQIPELINTDTALVVSLPILISQPRKPKTQKILLVIDDLKTPIKQLQVTPFKHKYEMLSLLKKIDHLLHCLCLKLKNIYYS